MSGVLIIGPSRSGTSMTAGLFAQHGVFFGDCVGPDHNNGKGYFENLWLRRVYAGDVRPDSFDTEWKNQLRQEGLNGQPWGAKAGAERWAQCWCNVPDISVIVLCYRPRHQIEQSRKHSHLNVKDRKTIEFNWQIMDTILGRDDRAVYVETDKLVEGEYDRIGRAFKKVGIPFDKGIADAWIDPAMWHY